MAVILSRSQYVNNKHWFRNNLMENRRHVITWTNAEQDLWRQIALLGRNILEWTHMHGYTHNHVHSISPCSCFDSEYIWYIYIHTAWSLKQCDGQAGYTRFTFQFSSETTCFAMVKSQNYVYGKLQFKVFSMKIDIREMFIFHGNATFLF